MNRASNSVLLAFSLSTIMSGLTGCAGIGTSRWAMDDEVYADRYDKPYSTNDGKKIARMMKQAVDARHVADKGGYYLGASAADDPFALGSEIGAFQYFGSMVEGRAGLKGLLGTAEKDWFLGGDFGLRLQAPTRLAPFVGVGTFIGGNQRQELAINDHIDNDGDLSVDERGERKSVNDFMASIYPELGMHFWVNSQARLTAGAQYHLTTQGRSDDFWFFGLSLSVLTR